MPGRGAMPKDPAQRRRRNVEHREQLTGDVVPERERPFPNGDWHPKALAWWRTWSTSPQSQLFEQTDWDALADLMPLEDMYHRLLAERDPAKAPVVIRLATELRLGQQLLGRTVADRKHLKWDVERATVDAAPSDVNELDKWRKRAAGE